MSVAGGSIEQLGQTAEETIEAAAAALLWAGPDSRGVLEHVAGASAWRMVESRCAYALYETACRPDVAVVGQSAFDADLINFVTAGDFEVAALPAPGVPQWTEALHAAMSEAYDDRGSGFFRNGPRNRAGRLDAAAGTRALRGSVCCHALAECSWWGRDPVLINEIEAMSRIVSIQTFTVPIDQF
jgi:hypothetical protein